MSSSDLKQILMSVSRSGEVTRCRRDILMVARMPGRLSSEPDLVDSLDGLFQGELRAVGARQLVDEALPRKGREVEIVPRRLDCLFVPIDVEIVDGPRCVRDLVAGPRRLNAVRSR